MLRAIEDAKFAPTGTYKKRSYNMILRRGQLPKASDIVVAAIRHKILVNRLAVGTRLPTEAELMEEHGVGRVAVREALRLLERDGLVDVRRGSHGGLFVRHADIGQVSDALALLFSLRNTTLGEFAAFRLAVEPEVARLASLNATDEQRAMLVAAACDDPLETQRSADLHSLIAEACGNDVYLMVLKGLHVSLANHFRHELITEEHKSGTSKAHQKITRCINSGDASGAQQAMTTHLAVYAAFIRNNNLDTQPIFPISSCH